MRFDASVPVTITDRIAAAMELAGGAGAHVVVLPQQFDITGLAVADVLALASYTGRLHDRVSRLSIGGPGISSWLDTYSTTAISRTSGTPSQWVGDLVTNGITSGTIDNTGATSVSRAFRARLASRRELLDTVASAGGWEYIVRPDFTVDAATPANLFDSHDAPELVVTRYESGPDGPYRGVDGGIIDQRLDDSQLATRVDVLAEGDGPAIAIGSATQSLSLKTWDGSTPDLTVVVSSPAAGPSNAADGIAQATLNLRGARREVSVSSSSFALHRFATPGDYVWLYDPISGLRDDTNTITFRGEVINPAKVRLLSWSYPIEAGTGVFVLFNGSTPELVDVTDWVEFETGDTFWTVGDWSPPSYGPVNRSNPEIEQRAAVPYAGQSATLEDTFSHASSGSYAVLSFDTTVSDPGGWGDVGGSNPARFTPGVAGMFLVSVAATLDASMSGNRFACRVVIDGTADRVIWDFQSDGISNPDMSGSCAVELPNDTSYLTVEIFQDSGGTVAGSARVSLIKI